jgi:hypothetical protein
MWAMSLSPAQFDEMLADIGGMDRKTGRAYLQLIGYLRRFGSVPSGERALCSVLGVTPRFLHEVAWPLLEDRLVLADDKQRYFGSEVSRGDRAPTKRAVPPELSEKRSKAGTAGAQSRKANRTNLSVVEVSDPDFASHDQANKEANGQANQANGLAKQEANSTAGAFGLHDFAWGFASEVAPSPSLSLASSASSQPTDRQIESEEEIERERGIARAGAGATGEQTIKQTGMQTEANGHAKPHANGHANTSPRRSKRPRLEDDGARITSDWRPTQADRVEAQRRGLDPDETANAFLDHWLGATGPNALSPDWSARFRGWCRHERGPSQQQHLMTPMSGGRSGKPAKSAFIISEMAEMARRRGYTPPDDDGVTLEGVAS